MARIIAHISEISRREANILLSYGSLFEYCVKRLGLSEGSVSRRIQVARVCRRFPRILGALYEGALTLTTASLIAPHLTEANAERLIAEARGKTKREVKEIVVRFSPKPEFRPSRRKISRPGAADPSLAEAQAELDAAWARVCEKRKEGSRSSDPQPIFEPASEDRYNYRFAAGREVTEKLERFAEVIGVELPHLHMEEVLGKALEIALEKKDPKQKLERRHKREARKKEKETRPEKNADTEGEKPRTKPDRPRPGKLLHEMNDISEPVREAPRSRRVPSPVQERVLARAGYRCEYRGPDGRRCASRAGLEIEHTRPYAVYKSHDERYLRAFCPRHNQLAAREYYGARFIARKVEESREERKARRTGREAEGKRPGARAGDRAGGAMGTPASPA